MQGSIKKLSNANRYVYPITIGDAVYVSPTLTLTEKLNLIAAQSSGWANKTWVAVGDSITEKNTRTLKNYHDYIKDVIGCLVYNYGQSGTGFYNRNAVASTITQTPDLITVFLGTNDWANIGSNNKALGSFGDSGTTTIAGCISTLFGGLISTFPKATIASFTPLPRSGSYGSSATPNSQGYTLEQLSDMIITHCKHYSIPCLDLYHTCNLYVWNSTANNFYFTAPNAGSGDGLHPNDAGHKKLASKILAFMNTL